MLSYYFKELAKWMEYQMFRTPRWSQFLQLYRCNRRIWDQCRKKPLPAEDQATTQRIQYFTQSIILAPGRPVLAAPHKIFPPNEDQLRLWYVANLALEFQADALQTPCVETSVSRLDQKCGGPGQSIFSPCIAAIGPTLCSEILDLFGQPDGLSSCMLCFRITL